MERDEAQLLAEAMALEPLSENWSERIEQLRTIAVGESLIMDACPECGVSLEGLDIAAHAETHYPSYLDSRKISKEGRDRRAALQRAAAKQKLPKIEEEE